MAERDINGLSDNHEPVPGPLHGFSNSRYTETRPRVNLNPLYPVMLFFALAGYIAIKTFEALVPSSGPVETPVDTEATLEELLLGFPWLAIVGLLFLAIGAVLLLIYAGLRLGGMKPVAQEPQNKVTWTLGALVKGLIVAFFIFIVMVILAPLVLKDTRLPVVSISMIIDGVAKILVVLWILFMLKLEYGARPADAGLSFKKPLRNIGYAFLTYLAIIPVFTLAAWAWKELGELLGLKYEPSPVIRWLLESDSTLTVFLVCFSAVVIAPLVEEFFFRGFTYPALRKRIGVLPAILVSSAYFSLIHFDFFSFLPIMILGVAMAFLYERRQTIIAPAALHFFNNARVIGLVLFLKYTS